MFLQREKDHDLYLYDNYGQDSNCYNCDTGCCAGIKSMFNKIKSFRFKKVKPSNKHLSKLLLGDDY
jgi:hypothetical protein